MWRKGDSLLHVFSGLLTFLFFPKPSFLRGGGISLLSSLGQQFTHVVSTTPDP